MASHELFVEDRTLSNKDGSRVNGKRALPRTAFRQEMAGHAQGIEDQWFSHDGTTLQDWQEAGDFVDEFETFAAYKVS